MRYPDAAIQSSTLPVGNGAGDGITDVYVGRQPIVDANLVLRGYELLYRDGSSPGAVFADGDAATYHVVARTILDMGFDQLVGAGSAFVNATAGFLAEDGYRLLPAERTVIEVLEDIDVNDDVLAWITNAARQGYRIALDDYTGPSSHDRLGPLLSFVKVDMLATPADALDGVVAHARTFAPQAVLIAEKVETAEDVKRCRDLGFGLFQGYFVGRPEQRQGRQVPASSFAALHLMAELARPDLSLGDVCRLIEGDPILAYRLLRLINSAAVSVSREVTSIRDGVIMTGLDTVRRLATVLALNTATASPTHLVEQLIVRAKMCQTIAQTTPRWQRTDPAAAFTTGLFSGLDTLLGVPMSRLLVDLPLSPAVQSALVNGSGALGELVSSALHYESAHLEALAVLGSLSSWRHAFADAVTWASGLRSELQPGSA